MNIYFMDGYEIYRIKVDNVLVSRNLGICQQSFVICFVLRICLGEDQGDCICQRDGNRGLGWVFFSEVDFVIQLRGNQDGSGCKQFEQKEGTYREDSIC